MRDVKVGVLELVDYPATGFWEYGERCLIKRQYAGVMPQAVSAWCRQLGHHVHYATYFGVGRPEDKLPDDLDVLFLSAYTRTAPLAYAVSRLRRARGTRTVIGGPHARAFPHHCLRHFDLVVLSCDKALIADILNGQLGPGNIISAPNGFEDVPTVEERMPELRASTFLWGRPHPGSVIPMLASVGCPHTCDFCVDWDSQYHALPLDRLAEDLRFSASRFPGTTLIFYDPNFGVRFDGTMDALETVPPGTRNPYGIETSLSNLRADRPQRLRNTNCIGVVAGVESWSRYGAKAGTGEAVNDCKVDQVVDSFSTLRECVCYLHANFMIGFDSDSGDGPFELTREFIRRAPYVRSVLSIPVPYGGTPLHEALRSAGRIPATLPFPFHTQRHLTSRLGNYDPISFLEQFTDVYALATSRAVLRARVAASPSPAAKAVNCAKARADRLGLRTLRRNLDRLREDRHYLAYHSGDTDVLPDVYSAEYDRLLGKYAELVPIEESQPANGP